MRVQGLRPYSLFFLLFLLFRAGFVSSLSFFTRTFTHAHTSFVFAPSLSRARFSSRSLQHKPTQPRVYTTSLSFVIHVPQEVTRAPRQQDAVSFLLGERSPPQLVPRFNALVHAHSLSLSRSCLTLHTHTHTHSLTPRLSYSHVSLARACSRYHLVSSRQHTQTSRHSHTDTSTSPPHTLSFTKRPP